MSLNHEFIIIPQEELKKGLILNYDIKMNREVLEIHDDIIQYIFDSLKWVPQAQDGFSNERKYGLNYHGITEIDKEGAVILFNILKAWKDLFRNSPPKLILTGNYFWTEGENIDSGNYEVIELNRDVTIEKFNKLMSFAEKTIYKDYQILHWGI